MPSPYLAPLLLAFVILSVAGCAVTVEDPLVNGYRFDDSVRASCPDGGTFPDGSRYDCTITDAVEATAVPPLGWTCVHRIQAWSGSLEVWTHAGRAGFLWDYQLPEAWPPDHLILAGITVGEADTRQTAIVSSGPSGFHALDRGLHEGDWIRFDLLGYTGYRLEDAGLSWSNVSVLARDYRSTIWPTIRLALPGTMYAFPEMYTAPDEGPEGPMWYVSGVSFSGTRPDGARFWAQVSADELAVPRIRGYYEEPEPPLLDDPLADGRTCPDGGFPAWAGVTAPPAPGPPLRLTP